MRYGFAFAVISLTTGFVSWRANCWPWGCFGIWVAVSFGGLSGLYFFRPPLTRFKQTSGRMSPAGVFIFWPYFLPARGILWLRSRVGNPFTEIAPGLFLGRRPFDFDRETLDELNIGDVLDLTWEFGASRRLLSGRLYRSLPVLDGTAPTPEQFAEAVKWLNERNGRSVLVHCALGNSRSASIVCAFLLADGVARTPEEAIRLVRTKRPSVGLNREQAAALSEFLARMPIY
jgi:diacylglycerol kinase (ATP)